MQADTIARAAPPLLEVRDLQTTFDLSKTLSVCAVDGVSFTVDAGETLAIVGESGSGKSVTSLSIMGLLPKDIGRITGGSIKLQGREISTLSDAEMREIRGKEIGMIFQEPMTSLNPVHTIGNQIGEMVIRHEGLSKAKARARSIDMLDLVGIPEPRRRVDTYPHEMSGGMRQRAMIAIAMSCNPRILIADEPTTALDVTIQAQIFELMDTLKRDHGTAIMLITHDMGVVAELADDVAVMYMGNIVEAGPVGKVLRNPVHPYTRALLDSIPVLGRGKNQEIKAIPGQTPDPYNRPKGCQFADRCAYRIGACDQMPDETQVAPDHRVMCWRYEEFAADAAE